MSLEPSVAFDDELPEWLTEVPGVEPTPGDGGPQHGSRLERPGTVLQGQMLDLVQAGEMLGEQTVQKEQAAPLTVPQILGEQAILEGPSNAGPLASRPLVQQGTSDQPPSGVSGEGIASAPAEIEVAPTAAETEADLQPQQKMDSSKVSEVNAGDTIDGSGFSEPTAHELTSTLLEPETIVEFAKSIEDELPDWLKEVARRGEPRVETAAPEMQVPAPKEPVSEEFPEPVKAPEAIPVDGQKPTESKVYETAEGDAEITKVPEGLREAPESGAEVALPSSTALDAGQIKETTEVAAPVSEAEEARAGQPLEGLSSEAQSTEPFIESPSTTPPAMPPAAAEQALKEGGATEFPDWMRELVPPDRPLLSRISKPLRTEPPQLRADEREELPDWLREPLSVEGIAAPQTASLDSRVLGLYPQVQKPGGIEESKYQGEVAILGEPVDGVPETEGPLAGMRGVLPLALGLAQPHSVVTPTPLQSDGARVFDSVLAAAARGSVESTPTISKPARRSLSKWWIHLGILLAALIPLFIPADHAGLGLDTAVNNTTPTAAFFDKIQSLAPGSTVLLSFDYDTGQAVELNPAASVIVQDLARRHINVVALSTLPTGVQNAQTILQEVSAQNPNWTYGAEYVNVGYIPGGEAGLRALSDNWLPSNVQQSLAALPLSSKITSLGDFALAIEFAGSEDSLRAWMEQVQPRHQVKFLAAVSAAVESQARNYLDANQLEAFLRGLGGAAEYNFFRISPASLSARLTHYRSPTLRSLRL